MDHTAALARISDIFYSGMSDREVCGEITYILSQAGFGPHALPPQSVQDTFRSHQDGLKLDVGESVVSPSGAIVTRDR